VNPVSSIYQKLQITPPQGFVDEIPRLYAPLKNYVPGIISLILEHVWRLKTDNHTSAKEKLDNCAWIGRLITLDKRVLDDEKKNDIGGWSELKDILLKYIDDCKSESALPFLVANCMQVISPIIEKRFIENYHFPPRMFHCWWYTIHDNNTHAAIHLVNAYQPDSPFDHFPHFVSTMLQAIENAVKNYPDLKIVSCGSWLNQLPKFQQLWPESFKENQKIINETGGFGPGAWGQYMTTFGGFNEKKANVLRKTSKHPFTLTEAKSPLKEVQIHLKKLIAENNK
jgi:hypothetical protein